MNYAEFSSKSKNIICRMLGFVPTKIYLKIMDKIKTGRKLDFKNPVAYSEKIIIDVKGLYSIPELKKLLYWRL